MTTLLSALATSVAPARRGATIEVRTNTVPTAHESSATLDGNDVHVWEVPLGPTVVRNYEQLLNQSERERARRFRFIDDRVRYINRRGILRTLLASYLGLEPVDVQFDITRNGKPYIRRGIADQKIRFNLSHSKGLGLFAFSRNTELGVDIEYIDPKPGELQQIAEHFFSPREARVLSYKDGDEKVETFYHCWTQKEAFIKAVGRGVSYPLDSFDVSMMSGECGLVHNDLEPAQVNRWTFATLPVSTGFKASIAIDHSTPAIVYYKASNVLS